MASPEVLRARLREEIVQYFPIAALASPRLVDSLVDAITQVTFDHLTAKASSVFDTLEPVDKQSRLLAECAWTAISGELR